MHTRLMLVALALGACSPDDLDEGGWLDLPDDVLGRLDVAALGEVRLGPEGPVVASRGGGAPSVVRWAGDPLAGTVGYDVVAAGERVGVKVPLRGLELVLWLDREDARTWIVEAAEGGASVEGSGARFEPGVPVEPLERRGDRMLVALERPEVEVEAWIPVGAVDQVRDVPVAEKTPALTGPLEGEARAWLAVPTELHDAPDGAWLATLHPTGPEGRPDWDDDPVDVRRLGPDVDGWAPIAWAGVGLTLDAWVPAERLVPPPVGLKGWGGSGGYSCGGHGFLRSVTLPAGTLLYDGQEGAIVGEAVDDVRVSVADVGDAWSDGWRTLDVETLWGDVEVWIEPGVVEDEDLAWPALRQ